MTNSLLDRVLTRLAPTGRQGRQAFILNVLAIWVVVLVTRYLIGLIGLNDSLNVVITVVVQCAGLLLTGLQMVKRLHDFNRPFEIRYLLFPLAHLKQWLGLIVSIGDEVPNDYGP
jgi:uncharacterized membrane protein YhaH (DUF805 family)